MNTETIINDEEEFAKFEEKNSFLTRDQVKEKLAFIGNYVDALNPASASKVDSNANVTNKNIATLQAELFKDYFTQINKDLMKNKIKELFGTKLAKQYIYDLESHVIYQHDMSSLSPYCASISMYPFLIDGMTKLGGESKAPKHLESFIGSFGNLMFAISSQLAGAVASVEFLAYFDYFARHDFGDDYLVTHEKIVKQYLQHVVYVLNQPATARGFQSIFWNISIFDSNFFNSLFEDFYFPDGDRMKWETVSKLQKYFVSWFREERKKALLTFPVVTMSALVTDDTWVDQDYLDFTADEFSKGSEFFIYTSKTVDSLSSCCRLRNALATENEFSYTLGAGGIMTGSKNVITLNINRIIQTGLKLEDVIDRVQKYQVAFDKICRWYKDNGLLSIYDAGFIDLDKQYLTLGMNGVVEAAEFLGLEVSNNPEYLDWLKGILGTFKDMNKEAFIKYGLKFNTEMVPAENLGVKNAKWDKRDGLKVNRDCYNSYFYIVEKDNNIIDMLEMHGREVLDYLDGGSAVHFNNSERLTKEQYLKLFESLAITGSNYFCENVLKACCTNEECGYIHPNRVDKCPKCGADVDYATRVIGYLKKISSFSEARQKEAHNRNYV